jgi:hypothetical protein
MITSYKDLTIGDIIEWCQENGQVAWLKAKALEKRPFKKYPRIKVNGKWTVDKTQEPQVVEQPISFIQLKKDFVEEFLPDLAPEKKEKKPTMYELIAALED